MKKVDTPFRDLFIIEPDIFKDARGFFYESFSEKKYLDLGIEFKFVQDNISYSSANTLRGLHYQIGEFSQGKLCQVLDGKVLDVAVDIRFGSPTFGQSFGVELSSENKRQLWIPPGFAHGFSVLSKTALFSYKCTNYYSKENERCIIYNDADLNINWGVKNPIISDKDLLGVNLKNIDKDFTY
ncbi:MAG: dTDP-4-dehydrorhamnose 3,5-epimerase [Ignavibacteriales bacterium]|nr:dTDP-4-dehydrorhamnose 3,5-epimerase [Ignavibacteriales bacterium]